MAEVEPPQFVIIAGPNGAGKSTSAEFLLPEGVEFVNADEIAKSLPGYPSPMADLQAGKLLLRRFDELARQRSDFAIETTLATRALVPRIARLREAGYRVQLLFLWLPDADLAVERVAERVRRGGHSVPEEVIRRRYKAGLQNFVRLYRTRVDTWGVYINAQLEKPILIAEGAADGRGGVVLPALWEEIMRNADDD